MNRWVILGKPECPFCDAAKDILHKHDQKFTYMDITGTALADFLINSGLRTVPQVYLDGERIGSYDNLSEYLFEKSRWEPRPAIYPAEWDEIEDKGY